MALTSSIPTDSLPLTALYSGAGGILLAMLSMRVFIYRATKGSKAFFGDQNIPAAPKLQSIVRVRLRSCLRYVSLLDLSAQQELAITSYSAVPSQLG